MIGNICFDSVLARDSIIMKGGLKKLIKLLYNIKDKILSMHCCWAISNLCRGDPLPTHDHVKKAIAVLCRVIATDNITDK
jgi:hypothetical protein